jgi:hypothetical protein
MLLLVISFSLALLLVCLLVRSRVMGICSLGRPQFVPTWLLAKVARLHYFLQKDVIVELNKSRHCFLKVC